MKKANDEGGKEKMKLWMKDFLEINKRAKKHGEIECLKYKKKLLLEQFEAKQGDKRYDRDKFLYYKIGCECDYRMDFQMISLSLAALALSLTTLMMELYSVYTVNDSVIIFIVWIFIFGCFVIVCRSFIRSFKERICKEYSIILNEIDKKDIWDEKVDVENESQEDKGGKDE